MRSLLDMGLAQSTASFLERAGHDALLLRAQSLQKVDDRGIIGKSIDEGRVILTHDLDFCRIIALSGQISPTVVTFRLSDMRPRSVDYWIQLLIDQFNVELERGALVSVGDRGVRIRPLPVPR